MVAKIWCQTNIIIGEIQRQNKMIFLKKQFIHKYFGFTFQISIQHTIQKVLFEGELLSVFFLWFFYFCADLLLFLIC